MKKRVLISIFVSFLLISGCVYHTSYSPVEIHSEISSLENIPVKPPKNFTEAKKEAWKIYAAHPESFYCQCAFTSEGEIIPESCPYSPNNVNSRTYKVEWEHIMPAKIMGGNRPCWQKSICIKQDGTKYKGRVCCAKVDRAFQQMEADLHNLVPAIGSINQARGTYPFGIMEENRFYGMSLENSRTEKR